MRTRLTTALALAVLAAAAPMPLLRAAAAAPSPHAPASATPAPQPSDPALGALLAKMVAVNADVRSYEAAMTVNVAMHTFPYLKPTLTGKVYWERPDRSAVIFDTLPALGSQFKKVYPRIEAPSQWPAIYVVSLEHADRVRLVPRKHGRVDHVEVSVNDDGTIAAMRWFYNDGGDISMRQTFSDVLGHALVTHQQGTVELPAYKGDIDAAFTDYKVNVAIPASVFTS
ncbi:MAG: hypothetical protein KGM44_03650 [bacterium]|nr:hypothetical protein [bacterium]